VSVLETRTALPTRKEHVLTHRKNNNKRGVGPARVLPQRAMTHDGKPSGSLTATEQTAQIALIKHNIGSMALEREPHILVTPSSKVNGSGMDGSVCVAVYFDYYFIVHNFILFLKFRVVHSYELVIFHDVLIIMMAFDAHNSKFGISHPLNLL
jgi:hypothetical protein